MGHEDSAGPGKCTDEELEVLRLLRERQRELQQLFEGCIGQLQRAQQEELSQQERVEKLLAKPVQPPGSEGGASEASSALLAQARRAAAASGGKAASPQGAEKSGALFRRPKVNFVEANATAAHSLVIDDADEGGDVPSALLRGVPVVEDPTAPRAMCSILPHSTQNSDAPASGNELSEAHQPQPAALLGQKVKPGKLEKRRVSFTSAAGGAVPYDLADSAPTRQAHLALPEPRKAPRRPPSPKSRDPPPLRVNRGSKASSEFSEGQVNLASVWSPERSRSGCESTVSGATVTSFTWATMPSDSQSVEEVEVGPSISAKGEPKQSTRLGLRGWASQLNWTSQATVTNLAELEQRTPYCLKRVVESVTFKVCCHILILTNAVFIGVHAEHSLRSEFRRYTGAPEMEDMVFEALEVFFCIAFFVELAVRGLAAPKTFMFGSECRWNMFDLALVCFCLVDLVFKQVFLQSDVMTIRILRITRMARVLRIIRLMRVFPSLRLMIQSIISSMLSLLWVFLLLLFAMYVFSIFLMNSVLEHMRWVTEKNEPLDSLQVEEFRKNFGNIWSALISLFMAICGGRDWHELYEPLLQINWTVGFVFIFYIFFVVFGVVNIITGVFVDSMRLASQRDQDTAIQIEMKRAEDFRNEIAKLFWAADRDGSGTLSWEEFRQHLEDDRVDAYFKTLQIDTSQARALFVLLDLDESDEVPIERFVEGCVRMRGDAKSIDVNMLLFENEKIIRRLRDLCEFTEVKLDTVEREVGTLQKAFGVSSSQPRQAAINNRRTSSASFSSSQGRGRIAHDCNSRLDTAINVLAVCENTEGEGAFPVITNSASGGPPRRSCRSEMVS